MNVRTLYREGGITRLVNVPRKYMANIAAIQELGRKGQGGSRSKNYDIYYSNHVEKHEFGCGFIVGERLRHLVTRFNPVSDRKTTIRIKAKYFYITLICAHAPTEDKDDDIKNAFYERLEETYDRYPPWPRH